MPWYRLWRQSDNKMFDDKNARDEKHALELFGQGLGVTLTLTESPTDAGPPYMMGRIEKEVGWTKKLDISVWEVPPSSN